MSNKTTLDSDDLTVRFALLHPQVGWICPRCLRGVAPHIAQCPCMQQAQLQPSTTTRYLGGACTCPRHPAAHVRDEVECHSFWITGK